MRTQDLGPRAPGTGTQRPRTENPKTQGPDTEKTTQDHKTQDPNTWDPGTLNFFIELQNKTFKSEKSLTSKRDKAKHPLTYFFTFTIFLQLRFVSEILRKILGTVDFCLSDLSK